VSSHDDLEIALEHAERMLTSFDRATRELRTLRVIRNCAFTAALLVASVVFAIATGAPATVLSIAEFVIAIVLVAMAISTFPLLQQVIKSVHRQQERDLSGLVQLSRVVRDLLPVVAKNEDWSELRQLTVRARIGRFPISEESR
jgi:hypothetical protein